MVILQTANLTLSPCRPDDRADFIALELDPEVMHFLNGGPVDHERTDPNDVTFLMPRGSEPHVWTARRIASDAFVGWFCLSPEGGALAELGYRLRRAEWGRGLATEGARALVDWGLGSAGYDRIVACTMAVNRGSRRVMEKIGMKHVRTDFPHFPDAIPGAGEGEVWYELLHSEWRKERRALRAAHAEPKDRQRGNLTTFGISLTRRRSRESNDAPMPIGLDF